MPQPLSGPGIGLPINQNLYPSELGNAPYDFGTNKIGLAGGESIVLPAGDWYISLGNYLVLQFLDPIIGIWTNGSTAAWTGGYHFIKSDGFTTRIANLTGCPVGAVVAAYGSGYVQATTTVAVTGGGGSAWQPIVGGQLTLAVGSIVTGQGGAGYGVAPLVLIPPPPPPQSNSNGVGGIPASGYAVIASGTVSAFTFTNPGAGYPTPPVAVVVPSPFDPNLSTGITAATITFSLTGSGSITGVLCTNNGAPISPPTAITLTISGAGSQATIVPVMMQTIQSATVSGGGTGFGTVSAMLTTVGGSPSLGTITNGPDFNNLAWRPRPAQITLAITGTGTVATQAGTVIDGGLFEGIPTPVVIAGAQEGISGSVVGPTIAFTMGTRADIAVIQQAP
jgi:hypothetical protein